MDRSLNAPLVKIREIRWCSIGQNIGYEINGKGQIFTRPVIILKKVSPHTVLVVPTTSKVKLGSWYMSLDFKEQKQSVCINQIRIIDTRRLGKIIFRLPEPKFERIITAVQKFYFSINL